MSDLTNKKCVPCQSWVPPKTKKEAEKLLTEISGWQIEYGKILKITKNLEFKDFKESIAFINKVADLAEEEGHHPDIYISYKLVTLTLTTHFIKGLSDNDFILAAKIDRI